MREQTIPILQNAWLTSAFQLHRKQVFNVVIFKELLKSLVSVLSAKELVSDMLAGYEAACIEDTQLEASLAVFSRKKQADYLKEKEDSGNLRRTQSFRLGPGGPRQQT